MNNKSSKTAIVTSLLLALILGGALVINMATANPYHPTSFFLPTDPDTDLPLIHVQSPINTTYHENDIWLNVTVIQPDSWQQNNYTFIRTVSYTLDYVGMDSYRACALMTNSDALQKTSSFATVLSGIPRGYHVLSVIVTADSEYDPVQDPNINHLPSLYRMTAIQTVNFTVDTGPYPNPTPTTELPRISPTPTENALPSPNLTATSSAVLEASPSANPSQSSTEQQTAPASNSTPRIQQTSRSGSNPSIGYVYAIPAMIAIAIGVVSLFSYLKKHKAAS